MAAYNTALSQATAYSARSILQSKKLIARNAKRNIIRQLFLAVSQAATMRTLESRTRTHATAVLLANVYSRARLKCIQRPLLTQRRPHRPTTPQLVLQTRICGNLTRSTPDQHRGNYSSTTCNLLYHSRVIALCTSLVRFSCSRALWRHCTDHHGRHVALHVACRSPVGLAASHTLSLTIRNERDNFVQIVSLSR